MFSQGALQLKTCRVANLHLPHPPARFNMYPSELSRQSFACMVGPIIHHCRDVFGKNYLPESVLGFIDYVINCVGSLDENGAGPMDMDEAGGLKDEEMGTSEQADAAGAGRQPAKKVRVKTDAPPEDAAAPPDADTEGTSTAPGAFFLFKPLPVL